MAAGTTIRLPDALKTQATAYADGLGISLNALIAVALQDYFLLRCRADQPPNTGDPPPLPGDLPPVTAYADGDESTSTMSDARRKVGRNESCPCGTMSDARRKVGRNESCPCGSGRKYKVCCGR